MTGWGGVGWSERGCKEVRSGLAGKKCPLITAVCSLGVSGGGEREREREMALKRSC